MDYFNTACASILIFASIFIPSFAIRENRRRGMFEAAMSMNGLFGVAASFYSIAAIAAGTTKMSAVAGADFTMIIAAIILVISLLRAKRTGRENCHGLVFGFLWTTKYVSFR